MNFIGNRYELLNCDGDLELNKIYKARDAYDNKKVLIKVIEHNQNICKDFITNLIDENTMLKEIKSPYILNTIDVGIHCTEITILYYMVSEYYEGISLKDIMKGNYIHLEGIINMATQIVKGLENIYLNNMYCGDLNPTNILLDENYNVKICNVLTTKANKGVNIRACQLIKYLSPYQLCINYTDIDSDLFSLGVILFECIFKKLPYDEGENELQMLKNIDKGINWNEIKAINGNHKFINIIKKLLARNNKYTNLKEIIIDLSLVMYEKADIKEYENNNKKDQTEIIHTIERKKSNYKRKLILVTLAILMFAIFISFI